ncbi:23S rRNA pseudouridine(955/2504/2580) synthase [Gammaproteobacteria bacterium 42_54_T18]|nr:23S rRNA pseudouridine(955/2504/2580) synthase [Gammaproteobacteria bacterium 42_54_T18]
MTELVAKKVQLVTVTDDQDGQRLDNFLKSRLKGVPKSMLYRIIRKGEVRINKKRAKPDTRVQTDDIVRIPPVRMADKDQSEPLVGSRIQNLISDRILFEDDGLIVLNKPSGIAVHGGSGLSFGVIEALRQMRPESTFLELVHRLDRETSGCLMIAKKRSVLKRLHAYLRDGGMDKTYQALVVGRWKGKQHRIDSPLQKFHLASGERVVKVSREGKASLTNFRLLEHLQGATFVEAKPVTGRTHQIRVHTQFSGHPIAGDDKYTSREQNEPFKALGLKRLFLHAAKIEIPGVDGEKAMVIEAPLDDELALLLVKLRRTS